ncbi:methylated-DNA--[protein]-cysteine S-methyltransferase [Neiella marina]|uniref:Methylated-DNA--[protein]-cysteine S-methyltransferase n=1 Tax=Neiella holothuriorum TaxID=2870530 RepID=A0ABS7EJ11_9GAMM|nr:methylated-DNA--[protein]-cysteine S-methyltransferase [Neiella holothuriorum]MBW8192342.1 methylated-DNA--[protein]-cysteine S-methyltransferase [Neiella holothuriorum]
MVNRSELVSPWGRWQLQDDGDHIIALDYWSQQSDHDHHNEPLSPLAIEAQQQLDAYLHSAAFQFSLPLKVKGTPFQQKLWCHLQAIPAGEVQTYGEVAKLLNSAARAIGGACRANPIPLFIPCHRIVAKGGLGGFSGHTQGERIDLKRQLLMHEGVC